MICFLVCFLIATVNGLFADPLTVVTLQAWDGLETGGVFISPAYEEDEERAFRMDVMKSELGRLDADIALITELNGLPGSAESLSSELGYVGLYGIHHAGFRIGAVGFPWNLREGSVILARDGLEFQPLETKRFSGLFIKNVVAAASKPAPMIMAGKITVSGRRIYVFLVHWTGIPGDPKEELEELTDVYVSDGMEGKDYLKAVGDAVERNERSLSLAYSTLGFVNSIAGESPVILAGSFNVTPDSREMEVLRRAGFSDSWDAAEGPGYTLDGSRNLNIQRFYDEEYSQRRERLDYILYRGEGLGVNDADIVFDIPTFGVHPSDRFGVYVKFDIPPASE